MNLLDRCVAVYRDPQADGRYADRRAHAHGETIHVAALPGCALAVDQLLQTFDRPSDFLTALRQVPSGRRAIQISAKGSVCSAAILRERISSRTARNKPTSLPR